MAGINFMGSYSGIDQTMIDQLMKVERLPLNQLNNKKVDIASKQSAWKDVNTRLKSLFDKLEVLQKPETFTSMITKSSNDGIVTMAASKDAVAGKYEIQVTKLATSTRIIGGNIGNVYDTDGKFTSLGLNGKLTLKNQDYSIDNPDKNFAEINIDENSTLKDIVNKINENTKSTGINATIINSRLVLADEKTGERGINLSFDGTNGSLSDLGLTEGTVTNGTKAQFTINNVPVTSDSNTVKDAVLGLTINLNKEHKIGESDTVTVSKDTEKLTKAVQDFVDQYNSTMSFIEEKLAVGTVSEDGTTGRGILAGDSSLKSLHSSLRRMVTDSLGGNAETSIKDISVLGISTTDKTGRLSFNASKFLEEFSKDSQNVINFFKNEVGGQDAGFVSKLNSKIDTYISSKDGLIKSKNESFDRTLKDLNKQIDNFNARMVKKEQYYTKMFAALDTAMMQAESQMSWLDGQISAMNGQNKK